MKKFTGIILSVLLIGSLSACGNNSTSLNKSKTSQEKNIVSANNENKNRAVGDKSNSNIEDKTDKSKNYDNLLSLLGATKEKVIAQLGEGEYTEDSEITPYMTYNYDGHNLIFGFNYDATSVESIKLTVSWGVASIDSITLNGLTLGMLETKAEEMVGEGKKKVIYSDGHPFEFVVYDVNGYETAYDTQNGVVTHISIYQEKPEENNNNSQPTANAEKNDWTKGYTYRTVEDIEGEKLYITYNNTGSEILLASSNEDPDDTKFITNIINVNKSYDESKLYFETISRENTKTIHVVDLNTLQEKFFTKGKFVRNVGEYPYDLSVIVSRGSSYFAVDSGGNDLCELGNTMEEKNLAGQIATIREIQACSADIVRLAGFENETINNENIEYNNYRAVVIPQYNGSNKDKLKQITLQDELYPNGSYTCLNFAVFGDVTKINVFKTSDPADEGNSDQEFFNLSDVSNSLINFKTQVPTDKSYMHIRVRFTVDVGEGMTSDYEFEIEDNGDISNHKNIKPILVR